MEDIKNNTEERGVEKQERHKLLEAREKTYNIMRDNVFASIRRKNAVELLSLNCISEEDIAEFTGLPLEDVKELKEKSINLC